MKRCPECRRDYYDETLLYCLDDGAHLVEGPATDEPATAILSVPPAVAGGLTQPTDMTGESPTRPFIPSDTKPANLASSRNSIIAGVIGVIVITGLGVGSYLYYGRDGSSQINSIAVMPFQNESGNADNEYLSDGMTETLINSLSQLPNLNVKARSSVFPYKGKASDARTIGKELSVQAILNGRVVQRGDGITLYLELVDAQSSNRIWGEQYNRKTSDLISLQSEIARDVSSKLKTKLSGADDQKLAKNYTENPEAYRLYLQGRFFWNKRGRQNLEKAIEYFEQAIAIDPGYALAYSGLADAQSSNDPRPDHSKPLEYALKALALDNGLAEAHASHGTALLRYNYDFSGAERAYRRAIELNPNYASAHQFYWRLLNVLDRQDEAAAEIRRALELEPLSLPMNWFYGIHLYVVRDYDASIRQLRKTIELDPSFVNAHISLADVLTLNGNYAEAIEQMAIEQELTGRPENSALIRDSFARGGWRGCWKMVAGDAARFNRSPYTSARMFAELGEKDKAFAELEKAYQNREAPFLRLKVDPRLDNLRDDPRYAELVKKVGFPE